MRTKRGKTMKSNIAENGHRNPERKSTDADATHERTPIENRKLRRNQEEREKDMGPKNCLPEQNSAGLNEKDDEDEEEDLYRVEENRGAVEAS